MAARKGYQLLFCEGIKLLVSFHEEMRNGSSERNDLVRTSRRFSS
jgi:hypothetical protein